MLTTDQLAEEIHASQGRVVLAISGGGSRAVADLLEVPGASRTVLEAVVPYAESALVAWIGGRPDQFCSHRTARAMAMVAFHRASGYAGPNSPSAGIGCTSSLASDRPKLGGHRAYLALQTASQTVTWSLQFEKDRRTRLQEEHLVGQVLINAVAEACDVAQRLAPELLESEQIESDQTIAPKPWQDLLSGKIEMVGRPQPPAEAIFPGAFDPIHDGHRRMIDLATEALGTPISMEISIVNVEKPPLDFFEIERRLDQFSGDQTVVLSRAATFVEKSELFPGATFIVGSDTVRRIASPMFYADDRAACLAAIERIAERGCRFLVFGRSPGTGFIRLSDLDLPDRLRTICREIPANQFREDISSTEIRKAGAW